MALYVDGAPHSQTDSVVGFWVINLVTQRRHLTAVLRKRNGCTCGCKGWCSLYAIFRMLRWSFKAMAARAYPPSRRGGP